MKRNEIALIIVVVGLVVMTTYGLVNSLLGQEILKPTLVKTAKPISSTIQHLPDPAVFNKDAINPAVAVTIGDQSNQQPFTIGQ